MPPRLGTQRRLEEIIRALGARRGAHAPAPRHALRGAHRARATSGCRRPCTSRPCTCRSTARTTCETDGLFCISEWQLATVPPEYRGQVFLVPNSLVPHPRLDAERVRELRASLGAGDDDYLVGAVGRLARRKGFDLLIRAFERAQLPGARLVIVGDGSHRRRLEGLAGERVTLTGLPPRREGPLPGVRPVRLSVELRALRTRDHRGARQRRTGDRDRRAGPERHREAPSDDTRALWRRGAARTSPAACRGRGPRACRVRPRRIRHGADPGADRAGVPCVAGEEAAGGAGGCVTCHGCGRACDRQPGRLAAAALSVRARLRARRRRRADALPDHRPRARARRAVGGHPLPREPHGRVPRGGGFPDHRLRRLADQQHARRCSRRSSRSART